MTWIGWSFDLDHYTVELDPAKLRRLLELLRSLSASPRCAVSALEKLTGKLLCSVTCSKHSGRPLPRFTRTSIVLYRICVLYLQTSTRHSAPACPRTSTSPPPFRLRPFPWAAGCSAWRTRLKEVPEHISSRRVWVQVSNPLRPERELSPESLEVISMWSALASSPQPFRSLFYRPLFVCEAFADACADAASAGLGGFVRLPDGRQACFAQTLSASLLSDMFPWFPPGTSPQHCIAAWEMLAQVALLWILSRLLPPGHAPFHVVFRTDNSPSQSAAWKGLTLARGMCQFLRQFCLLQEHTRFSVYLDSVPGFLK